MSIRVFTFMLALVPLTACAQTAQNAQTEGPSAAAASFSPQMRAQMQRIRLDAKTASLNALSADHRKAVVAAVKEFDSGSLSIPEAGNQIDAILTSAETSAVLAQQRKMRARMRQAFAGSGTTAPTGRRFGGGPRSPDAGRFLVQVLAAPDRWRAAVRRGAAAASPSP